MRTAILLFLFSSSTLLAQEVKYSAIFPEIIKSERVDRVDIDTLRFYSMSKIDTNTYYTYLIKPIWTHQIGLLRDGHFESVFQNNWDGNMIRSYFYQSESDPRNIIIVSPHCYDDGCSSTRIFEYSNQELMLIGDLVLYLVEMDPILGREFLLPLSKMSVFMKDNNLLLRFENGEYSQSENYNSPSINGPIEVVFREGKYELKHN